MIDLGILFTPLTVLLNTRIQEQTPARELAESLEGQTLAVRVRDTGLAVYLTIRDSRIRLSTRYSDDPDVVLSGSPISLAGLAGSDPLKVVREGHVRMSGDALSGARFQQLLRYAAPDLEDELSMVVGDTVAHQAGKAARGIKNTAGKISDSLHRNVGDYLTERRQSLPSRAQFDVFRGEIESLRDGVARATARARILQARLDEDN
ncbi:MAG: SCP2 sterol-binding domain-containing protein [Pseudomonadota bacterium]